jgi:hypothetical protein
MEQRLNRPLLTSSYPKKSKRADPQKHEWFDGWMVARGEGLKRLVERTAAYLDHHEQHTEARVRAGKPADEAAHRKRIEAVICHLAHTVLLPPPTGRVAVKLGH